MLRFFRMVQLAVSDQIGLMWGGVIRSLSNEKPIPLFQFVVRSNPSDGDAVYPINLTH